MYKGLPKHKGPSPTGKKEKVAIKTLINLLDEDKVLYDINYDDKFPNIDGYLQILDDKGIPMGNLAVQVKYRDWDITNPKARKVDLSIFSYTTITNDPVLFIGADNDNAYWLYICQELFIKNNFRNKQKTASIDLELDNILDGCIDPTNSFLKRWAEICKMHQYKFRDYDNLKKLNNELIKKSDPILRVSRPEFRYIHIFLDKFNELIDNLPIIRDRYYPNAWKIGFACFNYNTGHLKYALYSIPFEKNDIQIRRMDNPEGNGLPKEFRALIKIFFNSNPIIENPEKHAIKDIKSDLYQLLSEKQLYNQNIFLANEFIYAFIKKQHKLLELEIKDQYDVSEIKNSLNSMSEEIFEELIRASKLSLNNLLDLLLFLEIKGIKTINKVYLDTSEVINDESGPWLKSSYDNAKENWKLIIKNVAEVYNDLIKINFPGIEKEIPIFNGSSSIVFILTPLDEFRYMSRWITTYSIIGYKDDKKEGLETHFYEFDDINKPEIDFSEMKIKINGKSYEITYNYYTGFNIFDLDEVPMFDFVYMLIKRSIDNYFKKIAKDIDQ